MNAKIIIEFNDADGTVSLSNNTGIIPIAKIKNNVVNLDTSNKEVALNIAIFMQHLGIDIQKLVETT